MQYNLSRTSRETEKFIPSGLGDDTYIKKNCHDCVTYTMDQAAQFFDSSVFVIRTESLIDLDITCGEQFTVYLFINFINKEGKLQSQTISLLENNSNGASFCSFQIQQEQIRQLIPQEYRDQISIFQEIIQYNGMKEDAIFNFMPFTLRISNLKPDSFIKRTFPQPEISEAGYINSIYLQDYQCNNCSFMFELFELIDFIDYDSILPIQKPKNQLMFRQQTSYPLEFFSLQSQEMAINFGVSNVINYYERQPESILSWISKMGGIIASTKLFLLSLYFINRYLFNRKLKKKHDNFLERYSIEKFDELLSQVQEMAKEIKELKRKANIDVKTDQSLILI